VIRSAKSLGLFTLILAAALVAQDKNQLYNDLQQRPMRVGRWFS